MRNEATYAVGCGRWDGKLDASRTVDDYLQQARGRLVAEHGVRPAPQDRRHPPPVQRYLRATNRVDTAKHRMEPSARDPVLDRLRVEAEFEQLGPRNHAVLPVGKAPHAFA